MDVGSKHMDSLELISTKCLCSSCILYTIRICFIAFMDCFLANAPATIHPSIRNVNHFRPNSFKIPSSFTPREKLNGCHFSSRVCFYKWWLSPKTSRWSIRIPGIICSLHRGKTTVLERILFEEWSASPWSLARYIYIYIYRHVYIYIHRKLLATKLWCIRY